MESLVYLAGPITGVSYAGSTDWRKYVASKFPPTIIGLSPMRAKLYLQQEQSIKISYEEYPLSSGKGITARDRNDVMRSNLVLFNFLGAEEKSLGSAIEVGWADAFRKPMVIAMEKEGNVHSHAMIKELAPFIVPTLDQAIEMTIAKLSIGV